MSCKKKKVKTNPKIKALENALLRNSPSKVFCKKSRLKHFAKFIGNHHTGISSACTCLSVRILLSEYFFEKTPIEGYLGLANTQQVFVHNRSCSERPRKCLFIIKNKNTISTNFTPMFHFYISWIRQKTFVFLTFSGGVEMKRVYCLYC